MPFTTENRDELCDVFDEITEMARGTLKSDNVLPASITLNREKVGITIEFRKLYPKSETPTLSEQIAQLANDFPIGCQVRLLEDGIMGKVKGYQMGAHIKRPNEVALTVNVPADVWVLYPNQVERVIEAGV